MWTKLSKFERDLTSLFLRWGLAAVFIVHGMVKLEQHSALIREMSLNEQILVGWAELLGGIALAIGLLSRVAALGFIVIQIGAIVKVTGQYALMVAPMGKEGVEYRKVGPEFNLVLITMCLCVMLLGSGIISFDHLLMTLWRRRKNSKAPTSVAVAQEPAFAPPHRSLAAAPVPGQVAPD